MGLFDNIKGIFASKTDEEKIAKWKEDGNSEKIADFTDESYEQYNLFDQDKFERLSRLNSAIDKIRDKYGDDAIVRACFADTPKN